MATAKENQKKIKEQKKEIKLSTKEVVTRAVKYIPTDLAAKTKVELKELNGKYKAKNGLECIIIFNQYMLRTLKELGKEMGNFDAGDNVEAIVAKKQISDFLESVVKFNRKRRTLVDAMDDEEAANRTEETLLIELAGLNKILSGINQEAVALGKEFRENTKDTIIQSKLKRLQRQKNNLEVRISNVKLALDELNEYAIAAGIVFTNNETSTIAGTIDKTLLKVENETNALMRENMVGNESNNEDDLLAFINSAQDDLDPTPVKKEVNVENQEEKVEDALKKLNV